MLFRAEISVRMVAPVDASRDAKLQYVVVQFMDLMASRIVQIFYPTILLLGGGNYSSFLWFQAAIPNIATRSPSSAL